MRFAVLDGIRGHLLFMMMLLHLSWQPGLDILISVHHSQIIALLDAEFLVFLSGLLVGILYTMKFDRQPSRLAIFLWQRVKKIYRFYLVSAVPFLAVVGLTQPDMRDIGVAILEVLTIQNGGSYSDILPIYVFCFALLLAFTPLLRRRGAGIVLLPSMTLYAVSQLSYTTGFFGWGRAFMIFDIAAWQFLFFIAFAAGAMFRQIRARLCALPEGVYIALFCGLLALSIGQRWMFFYPPVVPVDPAAGDYWFRMQLHPMHILRTLIICGFVAVAVLRGTWATAWFQKLLVGYFTLPILRYCGVYAIQMFVIHVFLVFIFQQISILMPTEMTIPIAIAIQSIFMAIPFAFRAQTLAARRSKLKTYEPR